MEAKNVIVILNILCLVVFGYFLFETKKDLSSVEIEVVKINYTMKKIEARLRPVNTGIPTVDIVEIISKLKSFGVEYDAIDEQLKSIYGIKD